MYRIGSGRRGAVQTVKEGGGDQKRNPGKFKRDKTPNPKPEDNCGKKEFLKKGGSEEWRSASDKGHVAGSSSGG